MSLLAYRNFIQLVGLNGTRFILTLKKKEILHVCSRYLLKLEEVYEMINNLEIIFSDEKILELLQMTSQ